MIDLVESNIARRIKTQRVAVVGIYLGNAAEIHNRDVNGAGDRFKRPDPAN